MRIDEDYLRELELWPMFALQQRAMAKHDSVPPTRHEEPASVTQSVPVSGATYSPSSVTASVLTVKRPALANTTPVTAAAPVPVDAERAARIAALDWVGLEAEAANCTACNLCKQRKQAVLGVGAKNASWLLIGEGPGADEDLQGEPFVGQAGKLLDAMLTAIELKRGREVYIANVVKCRPPGNRTPTAEESQACAPLLDRQIELIQPKLMLALGKTAAVRLTQSEASMASLRGQLHSYTLENRLIPVVATYHPAYLLRNPPDKVKAWEDLLLAKKTMSSLLQLTAA